MSNPLQSSAVLWIARALVALILLQTLFFKFTGAEESVWIFSTLGVEPWGRIGSGIVELVASVLIVIPATSAVGALIALGTMAAAILSHLAVLGIEVQGDGGLLFGLALVVAVLSALLLWTGRAGLPLVGARLG